MNDSLFEILLYLFENYPVQDLRDGHGLRDQLDEAGFLPEEVDEALDWLRGAETGRDTLIGRPSELAYRHYPSQEAIRLSAECRDFLQYLQNQEILSATNREIVIDRLLALADQDDVEAIELEQTRWVVMMVLSNQADDVAYARLEALLHREGAIPAH